MSNPVYPSPQTVSVCLILITVFHVFAICLTTFRLGFRYYIRRLWWDDFWAALSCCCTFVCLVATWMLASPLDNPYIQTNTLGIAAQSRTTHVISWWMDVLFYTCSIWFARLSIVSSFIRIAPPSCSRTAALAAAAFFVGMWLYIMLAKTIPCVIDRSWYNVAFIQCPIPEWVAISEVITDSLSDIILVCLPLRLLWRLRVPSNQRTMIIAVFSSSILTSIISVIHTTYIIPPTFIGGVTADVESAVSLIVCNLLVIVTFIYRLRHGGRDMGTCDKSASGCLTTIEFGMSANSESRCPTTNRTTGSDGGHLGSQAYSNFSEETYLSVLPQKRSVLSDEEIELSPVPTRTLSGSSSPSWPLAQSPGCLSHLS